MATIKNYVKVVENDGSGNISITEEDRYNALCYASLGWKNNTQAQTYLSTNEWKDIPSNIPLTFQMVSDNTATILGNSSGYHVRYDGVRTLKARCAVHFGVDLSGGASIKKVAFRMVYNGIPLPAFLEMESNKDGEHGGSEMLLDLNQNDTLDFQMCNMTNTDDVCIKYMQIVATEV